MSQGCIAEICPYGKLGITKPADSCCNIRRIDTLCNKSDQMSKEEDDIIFLVSVQVSG